MKNNIKLLPLLLAMLVGTISTPVTAQEQTADKTIEKTLQEAYNALEEAAGSKMVDVLAGDTPLMLPVGITQTIGNTQVTIALSKVGAGVDFAWVNVYAKVELQLPGTGNGETTVLMFGAENLKFSYQGQFVGDATLSLLHNAEFRLMDGKCTLTLLGGIDSEGHGQKLTYANIGCQGITRFGLAASVTFPTDLICQA
ncbi:MAG: hypothetical protein J6Z12_06950, partial [Paludibacteraceae bacterium]|nr:hypothetical protein [Paludibacteraceae bacterium]